MRRESTYVGQQVYEWLFSAQAQNNMTAMAKMCSAVFGTSGMVNGLACAPTSPASMGVNVGAGEVYQMEYLEATACGTLPQNTTYTILKQGIQLGTVALSASNFPAPSTPGQSINYLIEAQYQDQDLSLDPTSGATPVVLQFYNSSNPATPWSGPNNSGASSNTFRDGVVVLQVKAGVAATTGSQVTPSPDSGWLPTSVVTVAYGQSTITAPNISTYPGAPFIPSGGMLVGGLQQNLCNSSVAGGNADALTGSYFPGITALPAAGAGVLTLYLRAAYANTTTTPTFTPNSGVIAAKAIVKGAGAALAVGDIAGGGHWIELQYDATLDKWVLLNPATGVSIGSSASIQGAFKNLQASAPGTGATVTVTADEFALESAGNAYVTRRALSLSGALTASGANGLDNTAPQTVTITIASPGVVTLNGHGFPANAAVVLSTTGALPTGLTAGTTYYVVSPTTNTFQLSATKGGSAINTSGSQSGTQSIASVLAASSWYSRWIIDNGTTTSLLWSSSATAPVLPSGYTYKARCGWDYTDPTNKYPLSFKQYGRRVQYVVAAGSNVTAMPQMSSGTAGSITTPTWIAVGVSNFVPPTASKIVGQVSSGGVSATSMMVAPNNSYGAYTSTTNPPFMFVSQTGSTAATSEVPFEFLLESTNIYWASNATAQLYCSGWEDNL